MEASPHDGFTAPDHLLCINGLDKRQEIAIQLESYIELDVSGFRLRAEDVSTILMAPIEHFESGQVFSVHRFQHNGVRYYPPLACYMKWHLEGIAPLCSIDTPIFRTNLKLDDHVRDREEEAECLEPDGKACVVFGTENPMVSHIIPCAWNDTKEHKNVTGDIKMRAPGLFRLNINGAASYICNPHELGGTDKVWNMMCLHPELYKLWAKGYCTFKHTCTERCDANKLKATLQFRWMQQIKKRLGQEIDVHGTGSGSDWQQWIEELNCSIIKVIHPWLPAKKHFDISPYDTKHFGEVIDIQWACILFTALVGATGDPELLSMNPGDKVMQWIQSLARWADEHEHGSD
ncbi:hypothetical protein J7337_010767 [Fusarium musae]|uniref:HNH nuclease domain-containing protein n=1 Tax=Fusarium musae TaxID=1042133 RepID=A0A9P8D9L5_9HYPO|nr:hypothetical protein J7337_010767 [Fusarium musae]KAG9497895.1 hypothetical protein J7337_010767 [Fusarium musae]